MNSGTLGFVCLFVCLFLQLPNFPATNLSPRHWTIFSNTLLKTVINTTSTILCSLILRQFACISVSFLTWIDMQYHSLLWGKDDILWVYCMKIENSEIMMSAWGKILKQLKFTFRNHPLLFLIPLSYCLVSSAPDLIDLKIGPVPPLGGHLKIREAGFGCYNAVHWRWEGNGQGSWMSCNVQVKTVPSKRPEMCLLRNKNFTLMFIYWLIQQIFTEHLLYARHCSRCWGYRGQTKSPSLGKWSIPVIQRTGIFLVSRVCLVVFRFFGVLRWKTIGEWH